MEFRTEIKLDKSKILIDPKDKILSLGSCFADNIGDYFEKYRFEILKNPFGVLYNPASIYNLLNIVHEEKIFTQDDLIFDQEEWHSFYHHSNFSSHNVMQVLDNINTNQLKVKKYLPGADVVIITLGTSIVYEYKQTKNIVANCHKIPAEKFNKIKLSLEEVINYLQKTITLLKTYNKNIKIVFTVSPVRHWKDGAVENHISKSILLLAIINVLNENIMYFPSYEIMMDDLRDYRFYKQDKIHPNETAVEYIWEKFSGVMFTANCLDLMNKIERINDALNHRPRNIKSEKHQIFIRRQINIIKELINTYPHLKMDEDIKYFESQLILE
ncbi:MAG: GSCFA domain-containing protein [bacterium]